MEDSINIILTFLNKYDIFIMSFVNKYYNRKINIKTVDFCMFKNINININILRYFNIKEINKSCCINISNNITIMLFHYKCKLLPNSDLRKWIENLYYPIGNWMYKPYNTTEKLSNTMWT